MNISLEFISTQIPDFLKTNWTIVLIFLVCLLLSFYLFKKQSLQKNYLKVIFEPPTYPLKEIPSKEPPKTRTKIPDETLQNLTHKLEKFEQTERFLKKEVNLIWLANYLQTNSKYTTEVIKIHAKKNFNHYINGLRIQYILKKLKEDPQFREYKVSHLAEICGFSSSQVFTIAFKKETKLTPSQFIENLKKLKNREEENSSS